VKKLAWIILGLGVLAGLRYWYAGKESEDDASLNAFTRTPGAVDTVEAARSLQDMLQKGTLPGFSPGEDTDLESPVLQSSSGYPRSRVFLAEKHGEPYHYRYTVEKLSPSAPWRLKWTSKTGKVGRALEDYPAPPATHKAD
jgi:hypothetical protein